MRDNLAREMTDLLEPDNKHLFLNSVKKAKLRRRLKKKYVNLLENFDWFNIEQLSKKISASEKVFRFLLSLSSKTFLKGKFFISD